jgi:urocanate hydratase
MYRLRPDEMRARAIEEYPGKSEHSKAIMLMIQNNLDYAVAQHPHELIYGVTVAVFKTGQYLLTMQYLSEMTDEQTLTMYSGHPMGLFPSHRKHHSSSYKMEWSSLITRNLMIGKNERPWRISIWTNDGRKLYVYRPTE